MILFPALILSSLISSLIGTILIQTRLQSKIVANYYSNYLILQSLEDDIARFLADQPLLTSTLTQVADKYVIAATQNPSHLIYITIDRSSVPPKILSWSYSTIPKLLL